VTYVVVFCQYFSWWIFELWDISKKFHVFGWYTVLDTLSFIAVVVVVVVVIIITIINSFLQIIF
jgi:hypothetical protein